MSKFLRFVYENRGMETRRFLEQVSARGPNFAPLICLPGLILVGVATPNPPLTGAAPPDGAGKNVWSLCFLLRRAQRDRFPAEGIKQAPEPYGSGAFWQREKDSNPHIQSQSLLCYPYTIPLSLRYGTIIAGLSHLSRVIFLRD